jgi:hypothetical protein
MKIYFTHLNEVMPLWSLFIIILFTGLAVIRLGNSYGRKRKKILMVESDSPIGTVVGSTLGLLALLLAFTFGMAINRFNERKVALLEEINTIGTLYLRADFVLYSDKQNLQDLIKEYVKIRSILPSDQKTLYEMITKSEKLLDEIWESVVAYQAAGHNSPVDALLINSLNDTIDMHTKRVILGTNFTIPIGIWVIVLIVFIISMWAMGFQFGYVGHYSLYISISVALAFAITIFLIADVDHPLDGFIRIDNQPMQQFFEKLSSQ